MACGDGGSGTTAAAETIAAGRVYADVARGGGRGWRHGPGSVTPVIDDDRPSSCPVSVIRTATTIHPLRGADRSVDLTPVILEGTAVRLEPLATGHLDRLCEIGLDPALWEWTTTKIRDVDAMRDYVGTALRWQAEGSALPFATVERATGRVVGSTRFANADPPNRRVEIGWSWIARPWQRTVVNTEAKYLMLRHAFERLGCIRVEFKTDALNARSRTAILRIGAKEEGTLRSHMQVEDGRRRDSVYFSIIEQEWPAVRVHLEGMMRNH